MNKAKSKRFSLNWNKFDLFAVIPVFLISAILSIFVYFLPAETAGAKAYVYYDGVTLTKMDLEPENKEDDPRYVILFSGDKTNEYDEIYPTSDEYIFSNLKLLEGNMIIEINDGGIKVAEVHCPDRICFKQGIIKRPNSPIVCAHNYVTILIRNNDSDNSNNGGVIVV